MLPFAEGSEIPHVGISAKILDICYRRKDGNGRAVHEVDHPLVRGETVQKNADAVTRHGEGDDWGNAFDSFENTLVLCCPGIRAIRSSNKGAKVGSTKVHVFVILLQPLALNDTLMEELGHLT